MLTYKHECMKYILHMFSWELEMVYYLLTSYMVMRVFFLLLSTDFSRDQRIVFAVTRYDQYYSGSKGEEVEMEKVQETVQQHLKEVEIDVSLKQIVPVSGLWALTARQLMTNPEPKVSRRARQYFETLREFNESDSDDDTNDTAMATELEEASNIAELEKRLVDLLCILVMEEICRWWGFVCKVRVVCMP